MLRRSWIGYANNTTSAYNYIDYNGHVHAQYWIPGIAIEFYTNGPYTNSDSVTGFGVMLPYKSLDSNPLLTASYPVFTGLLYQMHTPGAILPADFGLAAHYANNTMSYQDKMIVSAGTNEWEILDVNNTSATVTSAKPMFLARVTG
jgi:hypothetical protein